MPDLSPAQMTAELRRVNEENEELRGKVAENERLTKSGRFTIKEILEMRGLDNPDDICEGCKGLGVAPPGTNERCQACGGSGNATDHWAVLQ